MESSVKITNNIKVSTKVKHFFVFDFDTVQCTVVQDTQPYFTKFHYIKIVWGVYTVGRSLFLLSMPDVVREFSIL